MLGAVGCRRTGPGTNSRTYASVLVKSTEKQKNRISTPEVALSEVLMVFITTCDVSGVLPFLRHLCVFIKSRSISLSLCLYNTWSQNDLSTEHWKQYFFIWVLYLAFQMTHILSIFSLMRFGLIDNPKKNKQTNKTTMAYLFIFVVTVMWPPTSSHLKIVAPCII